MQGTPSPLDRSVTGVGGPARALRPALNARGITKRFHRHKVLDDVNLAVYPGQSLAIIGANGCGKSTLLKICSGVMSPTKGIVEVRGRIAYCPQMADLGLYLTPANHFTWFGSGRRLTARESNQRGNQIAASLDWQVVRRQVRHLSGGTRQKLNVACSMMGDPSVILLDEPYQGFDEGSYLDFWDLVDQWRLQGIAVIVVTHMLRELHRVDDVLNLGEGRAA